MKILVIDVGGTHVKVLVTGQKEPRRFASGKRLTPDVLVRKVRELTKDWHYEAVSVGLPGPVGAHGPTAEPGNLGDGWVGFDFAAALGRPVKILNDAAMQALGSYEGGRMLFLGLGTGVGSTLIADRAVVPLELGRLPFRGRHLSHYLGREGLQRLGREEWQRTLVRVVPALKAAFEADYVVLGGGNARLVRPLPLGTRRGGNENAFRGGFRLWERDVAPMNHVSPAEVYKLVY